MQSVNHQVDFQHMKHMTTAQPIRPEPFIPERVARRYEAPAEGARSKSESGSSVRHLLAAAFRKLHRGVDAGQADKDMRDFYRSSGNAWTRGLSR